MKTTNVGHKAENTAAAYLNAQGFKIVEQNWRTRYCEIDIVAQKDNCTYFVEVKYRKNNTWGSGLDYINPSKQKQMARAAEMWVITNNWQGEYCLSAIEVSGALFTVSNVIIEL